MSDQTDVEVSLNVRESKQMQMAARSGSRLAVSRLVRVVGAAAPFAAAAYVVPSAFRLPVAGTFSEAKHVVASPQEDPGGAWLCEGVSVKCVVVPGGWNARL
jgi:hypothetical protein